MKRILAVVSNRGYWGVELTGPMSRLEAAGYTLDFATPTGARPEALGPSLDPGYVDPPLGKRVTSEADAREVRALAATGRLDRPLALSSWLPERPYFSAPDFLRDLEAYHARVREREGELERWAGLLLVGGSGAILDLVNNARVHDLVLGFRRAGKPIAAICYAVGCLVFARDLGERESIVRGKHVTGHCVEYDYKDGTGFAGTDFVMGPPPYVLEYLLRDAVGPEGRYHGNFGKETSVVVDYPFITARSLQCARELGDRFVDVLDRGLKRYGW